ncbi:MFS transporter [Streptomyces sp. NPDC088785]|uniref:MFS transporter n=1 Tax=Streptomyces sp. NPDC088785 TaxID=3365897 RepID=UPI0037F3C1AF
MTERQTVFRWAAVVGNADWCLTGPLVTAVAAAWRTDVSTVTVGIAAYSLGFGCALPVWGAVADRWGPRHGLRAGLLLAAGASTATALCPGPGWWVVLRAAAGAAFAAVPPCTALICDAAPSAGERHRAFAALTAATAAAAIAAPLLGALASGAGAWRFAYLTVAASCALAALGTRGAATGGRTGGAGSRDRTSGARHPPLPVAPSGGPGRGTAFAVVIGVGVVEGVGLLALPTLLSTSLTLTGDPTATALAQTVYATGVLGSAAVRRRPRQLSGPGGVAGAAGAVGIALVPGTSAVLGCAVLLGLAWGWLHTGLQTWLPPLLPPPSRARAAALFAASSMLAASLAVLVGTQLLRRGLHGTVFAAGALACALLACLARAVAQHSARHRTPSPPPVRTGPAIGEGRDAPPEHAH